VTELLAVLPVDDVDVTVHDGAVLVDGLPRTARLRLLAGARLAMINDVFEPLRADLRARQSDDLRVDSYGNETIWAAGSGDIARRKIAPWLARIHLPPDYEIVYVETSTTARASPCTSPRASRTRTARC